MIGSTHPHTLHATCLHHTTAAEVITQFVPPVATIPGVIEAENFAVGGQGISYYNIYKGEPSTVLNNDFRKDAELTVDVLNELIPDSGEYVVGWTEKGKQFTAGIQMI
jgi:hypothetical protein